METKRPPFLPKSWNLPDAILRRLGDDAGRQRLMDEEGHLLLILHQVPVPEDGEVRKPVLFWHQPSGDWKSSPEGGGLLALEAHLDSYHTAIHALDQAVDTAKTPLDSFEIMRWLTPLQRSTRSLLEVLQEARQALPSERRLINLRDRAVSLERAIALVAGDAKARMEFCLAENTEEQARFAHEATLEARKLNRMAAFFFPLATLAAIFGMNPPDQVIRMPGFWGVILAGVVAGLLIRRFFSRKRA